MGAAVITEAADWGGDTHLNGLVLLSHKGGSAPPPAHKRAHGDPWKHILRQELTMWVFQERKTQEEGKDDSTGESADRLLLLK